MPKTNHPEMRGAAQRPTRAFFRQAPIDLARALLGQRLVRVLEDGARLAGRIVEVEAYLGAEDRAAHTFNLRRTARNESMYADGGHGYVYFTYGMHYCFNVVAQRVDVPTAVLIRALEPLESVERMRDHRAGKVSAERLKLTDLGSGPAKLCQALRIDRALDGVDLLGSDELFIERDQSVKRSRIVTTARIGVAYAGAWATKPLRFFERGNPHVSGPRS